VSKLVFWLDWVLASFKLSFMAATLWPFGKLILLFHDDCGVKICPSLGPGLLNNQQLVSGLLLFLGWAFSSLCRHPLVYMFIYLSTGLPHSSSVTSLVTRCAETCKSHNNLQFRDVFHEWLEQVITFAVTQNGSSTATIHFESSFLTTVSKKYVLQVFENVI